MPQFKAKELKQT